MINCISDLVSIIVPVYNTSLYLDDCLESLVGQSFGNIEIIIVDDGSTDSSPAICDRWRQRDDRVLVFHRRNQGLSASRNFGLSVARGSWLLFVDSDDWVSSSLVQSCLSCALSVGCDIVWFSHLQASSDGKSTFPSPLISSFPESSVCDSDEALAHLLSFDVQNYSWSLFVRSSIYALNCISFPVGRNMEDVATTYRVVASADRVCFLNEHLYFYRQRCGSILSKPNARFLPDYLSAVVGCRRWLSLNRAGLGGLIDNYSCAHLYSIFRDYRSLGKSRRSMAPGLGPSLSEAFRSLDPRRLSPRNLVKRGLAILGLRFT